MNIVGITSPKGGDGATYVSANLAYVLSEKGNKCLIVDLHSGMRTLDLFLGVSDDFVFDLNDVYENRCTFKDALLKNLFEKELDFVTSSQTKEFSQTDYISVLKLIKEQSQYDFVILDIPSEMVNDDTMEYVDKCIFVASPNEASVRCLEKKVFSLNCFEKIYVIANKVIPELIENKIGVTIDDICDRAGIRPVGIIPFEPEICIFESRGVPSCTSHDLLSTKAMYNVSARIENQQICAVDFNYKTLYYKNFKKYFR